MKWQPIETAPLNTTVLVVTALGQQFVAWLQDDPTDEWLEDDASGFHDSWCTTDGKLDYFLRGLKPTHWMPLPEPPTS